MTEQEQRIALCGWFLGKPVPEEFKSHEGLPNTNSLDVLHEMESLLNESQQDSYWCQIRHVVPCGLDEMQHCFNALHATAAQRREALVRALGLWRNK